MFYYKKIKDNEIIDIGSHSIGLPSNSIEITKEEHDTLLAEFEEKWKQEAEKNPPVTEVDSIISEVANNGY